MALAAPEPDPHVVGARISKTLWRVGARLPGVSARFAQPTRLRARLCRVTSTGCRTVSYYREDGFDYQPGWQRVWLAWILRRDRYGNVVPQKTFSAAKYRLAFGYAGAERALYERTLSFTVAR